jgi:hypothetical protein
MTSTKVGYIWRRGTACRRRAREAAHARWASAATCRLRGRETLSRESRCGCGRAAINSCAATCRPRNGCRSPARHWHTRMLRGGAGAAHMLGTARRRNAYLPGGARERAPTVGRSPGLVREGRRPLTGRPGRRRAEGAGAATRPRPRDGGRGEGARPCTAGSGCKRRIIRAAPRIGRPCREDLFLEYEDGEGRARGAAPPADSCARSGPRPSRAAGRWRRFWSPPSSRGGCAFGHSPTSRRAMQTAL